MRVEALRSGGRGLLKQRFGLPQSWCVAHRCEQVAGSAEWSLNFGTIEGKEAAALAEERIRSLGNVPELPARPGFGVEACSP